MQDYDDWYLGFIGFCGSFGSKYFGGYGLSSKNGEKFPASISHIKNVKKQVPNLTEIIFECADFRDITIPDNSVIYCDPPYQGTTKYKGTKSFPYNEFYDWCREISKYNTVLISEYNMPDDFKLIWKKETQVNFDSNRNNSQVRVEKLFTV